MRFPLNRYPADKSRCKRSRARLRAAAEARRASLLEDATAPQIVVGLLGGRVVLVNVADRDAQPLEHGRHVVRRAVPLALGRLVRAAGLADPRGEQLLQLTVEVVELVAQGAERQ